MLAKRMRDLEECTALFAGLTHSISSALIPWTPNLDLALQEEVIHDEPESPSLSEDPEPEQRILELPAIDGWVL